MANEIKQIKVGNTTYNIEPYSSYYRSGCSSFEMNDGGSLLGYGGFIDFHFFNSSGKPLNSEGTVVSTTPDYTSRIIEHSAGCIGINGTSIAWTGLTSGYIKSNGPIDANSAQISNGLYVGTSITHKEGENLLIGNSSNSDYVMFIEDVSVNEMLTIDTRGDINTRGNINASTIYATSVYASSDRRLKENIKKSYMDYLNLIKKFNLVTYNWISDTEKITQHGLIAQELQEVLPNELKGLVVTDDHNYLAINDAKLVYVVLGALQQQIQINQELENRIKKLESLVLGV